MQSNSTNLFGQLPTKTCTKCKTSKPLNDFSISTSVVWQRKYRGSWCKACVAKSRRDKRLTPEGKKLIVSGEMKALYGITLAEYMAMHDKQNGLCAICHKPETTKHKGTLLKLAIDHCHNSGAVRRLLCNCCNSGLAHFRHSRDLLLSAIAYLDHHEST